MFKSTAVRIFAVGLALSLPAGFALAAGAKSDSKVPSADEQFLKDAAAGGMMEVELGKIAADKAVNDQVKAFGRQMQEDHGKANDELKTLAASTGVQIPTALAGKHKKTVDRLSKLSNTEFDRQYMRTMIDDHKEDLKAFQREADKGKDPDVKQFASKYVPMIQNHLEMAQATGKQLKVASLSKESR
jgi:putative membrane protein